MRALIVDDERIEREGIRFLIQENFDLEIAEAENGRAALRMLREQPAELLLTDVKMPFMDGLELIREARGLYPDMEVMIFSAYGEFDYARQAMKYGVESYLLKPVDEHEFCATLRSAMERLGSRAGQRLLLHEAGRQMNMHRSLRKTKQFVELMLYGEGREAEAFLKDELGLSGAVWPVMLSARDHSLWENWERIEEETRKVLKNMGVTVLAEEHDCFLLITPKEMNADLWASRLYDHLAPFFGPALYVIYGRESVSSQLPLMIRKIYRMLDADFYNAPQHLLPVSIHGQGGSTSTTQQLNRDVWQADYHRSESVSLLLEKVLDAGRGDEWIPAAEMKRLCIEMVRQAGIARKLSDDEIQHTSMQILGTDHVNKLAARMERFIECTYSGLGDDVGRSCVREILRMIEQEYSTDLSLEKIADRIYMTPNYVSSLFKRMMGTGIAKYLTAYRLNRACELLVQGNMKIQEVAQAVGYANPSYFCMIFRNEYGMSPARYREQGGQQ